MSSTEPNDKPEQPNAPHPGLSLAQQHSTVSPLIQSITGGEPQASDLQELPQEPLLRRPPPDALSQLEESELEDNGEQVESQVTLQPEQPADLSLSEQYGQAGLLAELNSLVETQQFQLAQHREHVSRSRSELCQQIENWKTRCAALEEQLEVARDRAASAEQKHLASQSKVLPLEARLDAAQQLTERLQAEVLDRRQQQMTLEEQLTLAESTLREQQEITAAQARSIVSMQAELSEAQAAVAILETRLSRHDHLRQQLKADNNRDRQGRSQARARQLQLEQETTQMKGQLLRLSEELRQSQRQSAQWRRQAQARADQLRDIGCWAAEAESVPPELIVLLAPALQDSELSASAGAIDSADGIDDIARLGAGQNHISPLENQSDSESGDLELSCLKPSGSGLGTSELSASELSASELSASGLNDSSVAEDRAAPPESEDNRSAESHASILNLPNFPQGTA